VTFATSSGSTVSDSAAEARSSTSPSTSSPMGDGYHHGDLPNALRRAAVEVIEERGAGGFSLREVARRAGVSHTAPAHHFGDMKGLLTSVAEEGFAALHTACTVAIDGVDDPVDQLTALGRAYVSLARTNRGHCEVMFRTDIIDTDDPELVTCGLEAYGLLEATVRRLIEAEDLRVSVDEATWLCWSAMQGLVQLQPKIELIGQLKDVPVPAVDQLIARFTEMMVDGIRNAP
jgi:AcrR family transcriptional regulator